MKIRNIFLTGQCSLHWGRLEHGNIGNYYVIEPFIRELKKTFPIASIKTTFQLSHGFPHKVTVLPIDLYYSWEKSNLLSATYELIVSFIYKIFGIKIKFTPYMKTILSSDLIIDFSGDIWGDNANLLGKNRLIVGILKNLIAQNLNKPTAMLAGSPGPFNSSLIRYLAKKAYQRFDIVTNREKASTRLLIDNGFCMKNTLTLACPSFLFKPKYDESMDTFLDEILMNSRRPRVGFTICGWNMINGPFNREDWKEEEFKVFVEVIKSILEKLQCSIFLISHSNGFHKDSGFSLTHGRDYHILKKLQTALEKEGVIENVHLISKIYDPYQTKLIIGKFDMMISGRIHAAVASLSQCVPTVIIDYGHKPKANKLQGFAEAAGIPEYIVSPSDSSELNNKILHCWKNRQLITRGLKKTVPSLESLAKENFVFLQNNIRSVYDI